MVDGTNNLPVSVLRQVSFTLPTMCCWNGDFCIFHCCQYRCHSHRWSPFPLAPPFNPCSLEIIDPIVLATSVCACRRASCGGSARGSRAIVSPPPPLADTSFLPPPRPLSPTGTDRLGPICRGAIFVAPADKEKLIISPRRVRSTDST